jgi:hypothetical protein
MKIPKGLKKLLATVSSKSQVAQEGGALNAALIAQLQTVLAKKNMVGIGISEKTKGDMTTGEPSLCFYVKKKAPAHKIKGDAIVPPFVVYGTQAYLTDVKEIGDVRLLQGAPIEAGISVSHFRSPAGSIGAIVKKVGKFHILSNSHVLALNGAAKIGDAIITPGTSDGGSFPRGMIATLSQHVPFDRFGDNWMDAAIAEIHPSKLALVRTLVPHLGVPVRLGLSRRGMQVVKSGKSTQTTTGQVIDPDFRVTLAYPRGLGRLHFVQQVLCTHFSQNGDSGSLVIDAQTGRAVGLLFAGSDTVSIYSPIDRICQTLGIGMV